MAAASVVSVSSISRPLLHGSWASSSASCHSASCSSLSFGPLRATAAPFSAGSSESSGSSGSSGRRIIGTRRASSLASPSANYIREDYLVKKVSAKELGELVKGERSVPIVVDFYATWCGPLAVEYENNVLFVKVDTDEEYDFANDMQVRGLPTLYFISPDPNKEAIRTEGLVPAEMIKNIIDNEL
ncbi:unnamed protein product [Spirodela intermedia]|uniref:Thioredoxin-like protein CITRX, chloroplastic n=1 Tax=Spirodela intermedia TaxID=51605 RepID=A0A7I8JP96_SPIIN|nr:unnamed protein product [Spirodela intermedia]CAA6671272.1 unnamed protein product [Spirodela intermedia]